jgi:hypothetical protein
LAYVINEMTSDEEMLDNLQVNVSDDGLLMLSTVADVELVLQAFGESKSLIDSTIGELPDKVPVYVQTSLGVDGDASTLQSLKVGNLSIPAKLLGSLNPYVDQGLDMLFENTMNITLDEFYVEDGTIHLTGDFPAP